MKQARKPRATLVWNYDSLTHLLTRVKCRATSVAKKWGHHLTSLGIYCHYPQRFIKESTNSVVFGLFRFSTAWGKTQVSEIFKKVRAWIMRMVGGSWWIISRKIAQNELHKRSLKISGFAAAGGGALRLGLVHQVLQWGSQERALFEVIVFQERSAGGEKVYSRKCHAVRFLRPALTHKVE